jgi:hypothetical protein
VGRRITGTVEENARSEMSEGELREREEKAEELDSGRELEKCVHRHDLDRSYVIND